MPLARHAIGTDACILEEKLGRSGAGVLYRGRLDSPGRLEDRQLVLVDVIPATAWRADPRVQLAPASRQNVLPLVAAELKQGADAIIVLKNKEGKHLGSLVSYGGPLDTQRAIAVLSEVATGLVELHESGHPHLNLEPRSVLVSRWSPSDPDEVNLGDWYLSQLGVQPKPSPFRAPEQKNGELGDTRTDVYAVGALLLYALTGQLPHEANFEALGPGWAALLRRAMAERPEARFQSMSELRAAILSGAYPAPPVTRSGHLLPTPMLFLPPSPQQEEELRRKASAEHRLIENFKTAARSGVFKESLESPLQPERVSSGQAEEAEDDDLVECTVFASPVAEPGWSALVQVFAHLPLQASDAAALAQEFDRSAARRAVTSLLSQVARRSILTFELEVPGAEVADSVQALRWDGRPQAVQFSVVPPHEALDTTLIATVRISQDSVPIGHVKFRLEVSDRPCAPDEVEPVADQAQRYQTAFLSYASQDRSHALRAGQMLRAVGIDYFQDVLNLEPGERWERRLYEAIPGRDLFFLFWSSSAADSEWVRKEVRYALKCNADDADDQPQIKPVILERPPVPPWPEVAHLHFNDPIAYFLDRP